MVNAIEIEHMSKKFGDKKILEDITMSIGHGDSICFIGHNGCGKSTMLKIIGKFLTYDEGKITYQKNLRFGYVPEHFPKLAITPRQYIQSVGRVQQMKPTVLEQKSRQLFHDFYMENMIDTPIKFLSKGTAQKVAVVQAVLEKPDIMLLDEPLSGQDTDSQNVFIRMMQEMNKEGMIIVMSCHEEWLLKAISKTVYEMRDKHFVQSDKLEKLSDQFTIMTFRGSSKNAMEMNYAQMMLQDYTMKIEKNENANEVILYVPTQNSDLVIRKMLYDGYELRRMHNEGI